MATDLHESRRALLRDIDALGKITVRTTEEEKGIFMTYRALVTKMKRYLEAEEAIELAEEIEGRAAVRALAVGEVRR